MKILDGSIKNNRELYDYTIQQGHIGTHSKDFLMLMKKRKEVDFEGRSPLVTYENVYKNKRIIAYHPLNK